MTEWVNMWNNYINFSDRTNVRGYWMAWLVNFIIGMFFTFLVEENPSLYVAVVIYSWVAILPCLALSIRRLRDAGKPWQSIFFSLVPIVGWVILIYYYTRPSIPDDGVPVA